MAYEQQTTYFENPLEFKFKIIDPDSKKIGYFEQNKDLVTTFLKENEIRCLTLADSVLAFSESLDEDDKETKEKTRFMPVFHSIMVREISFLANVTKSRGGRFLKAMTEERSYNSQELTHKNPIGLNSFNR